MADVARPQHRLAAEVEVVQEVEQLVEDLLQASTTSVMIS